MKRDKGTLKSKDLYKKAGKAYKAALIPLAVAFAGAITAATGVFVVVGKDLGLKKEIATSPAYSQYVLHETTKYNQQLEEGTISSVQYHNYIKKIDVGTFLNSEFATAEQKAVKEYNDTMTKNFGVVAYPLCGAGVLGAVGSLIAGNILSQRAKEREEDERYEALGAENQN